MINKSFRPPQDVIDYYRRMVEQFEKAEQDEGKAAFDFEGEMVDIAGIKRA